MKPTDYVITVKGRMGPALLDAFEGMHAAVTPTETLLRGRIVDQAALHGLLGKLRDIGLPLVSVARVDRDPTTNPCRTSNPGD